MNFRISAVLGTDNVIAIKSKINNIRAALPFLTSLSKGDRRSKLNLGLASVGYGKSSLKAALNNQHLLSRQFIIEDFENEVILHEQLQTVLIVIDTFRQNIDDTIKVLGQSIMVQSNEVYGVFKIAAKRENKYKLTLDELSAFYKKGGSYRKTKADAKDQQDTSIS